MFYAVAFFTYLASSIASVLIGGDAQRATDEAHHPTAEDQSHAVGPDSGQTAQMVAGDSHRAVWLSAEELAVLRNILDRAEPAFAPDGD
jgi:hypothetical protein